MTQEELYAHPGWEWCTAEGSRKQVLLLGLQTTFREKLEWLEETETMILHMRAAREAARNRATKDSASNSSPDRCDENTGSGNSLRESSILERTRPRSIN